MLKNYVQSIGVKTLAPVFEANIWRLIVLEQI